MKTPDGFKGRKLISEATRVGLALAPSTGAPGRVYRTPIIPRSWEEADDFHGNGAAGYELYLKSSDDGVLEDVHLRIDQCPHGGRNFAPRGAPAWIFGEGATFALDWEDVAEAAQQQILELLEAATAGAAKPGTKKRR